MYNHKFKSVLYFISAYVQASLAAHRKELELALPNYWTRWDKDIAPTLGEGSGITVEFVEALAQYIRQRRTWDFASLILAGL